MKIPRNVHGRDLANHLIRHWQFVEMRQTGSHIILRTEVPSGATVPIPAHKPVRVGTLKDIVSFVAKHRSITIEEVITGL